MEGLHGFWFPSAAFRARLQKPGSSELRPWERRVSGSLFLLRTGWSGVGRRSDGSFWERAFPTLLIELG